MARARGAKNSRTVPVSPIISRTPSMQPHDYIDRPLRCPACGYDVTPIVITTDGACPECGAIIDERNAQPAVLDSELWRDGRRFLAFTAGVGLAVGIVVGVFGLWGRMPMIITTFLFTPCAFWLVAYSAERVSSGVLTRTDSPRRLWVYPALCAIGLLAVGTGAYGATLAFRWIVWP